MYQDRSNLLRIAPLHAQNILTMQIGSVKREKSGLILTRPLHIEPCTVSLFYVVYVFFNSSVAN